MREANLCLGGKLTGNGFRKVIGIPIVLFILAAFPGCGGKASEARGLVEEALGIVSSSRSLLEDLLELDERFDSLGRRYTRVEETLAEGKSLAETAQAEVEELESRYGRARQLLERAAAVEGGGAYREYARLALQAVDKELEALSMNRRLLNAVYDLLDVLPLAESAEQLSYYVEEIERLRGEVSRLLREGAESAAAADAFHREHGL